MKSNPGARRAARFLVVWCAVLAGAAGSLRAQDQAGTNAPAATATNAPPGTPEEQVAALQSEVTNTWRAVLRIVNQPVQAYVHAPGMEAANYPEGWFHPGATRPEFDTVDVRQTQEFPYDKFVYVTSPLNPGVVFMGRDLEFNSMTKFFYADRSRPKHKLSQAEMVEINRLYRIIGHCEAEIRRMQNPPQKETGAEANADTAGADTSAPKGLVGAIQTIPRQKRILYGGIAIGALVVVMVVVRIVRRPPE